MRERAMKKAGKRMSSMDLELLPHNMTMIREWSSKALYVFEVAGSLATFHLDERITGWVDEGKTQAWMAEEVGCGQASISRRLKRLGIKTKDPRGGDRKKNFDPQRIKTQPVEVVSPEDTEILDDDIEEICPACHGTGRVMTGGE